MTDKLEQILRFVLDADDGDAAPVDPACEGLLSAYIEAELAGEDAAVKYPAVQTCIEQNVQFAQAYAELKALLAEEATWADPPTPPAFDFSYLPAAEPVEPVRKWWRLNEAGHLIIQVTEELLRSSLNAVKKLGDELTPADGSGLALAGQLRSVRETLLLVALDEELDDLAVEITVEARPPAEVCDIVVAVDIPSRGGWPNLADVTVAMLRDDQLLGQAYTDAFGKAAFTGVEIEKLPELKFEIAP